MTATALLGRHLARRDLTGQQRRVMAALLTGATVGEVARDLRVGVHTVYWHMEGLRKRFGVRGGELFIYCYQHRDCCRDEFDP